MSFNKDNKVRNIEDLESAFSQFPVFNNVQLDEFGKFMEAYRIEKEIVNFGTNTKDQVSFIDMNGAAVGFGAMRMRMHLGVPTYEVIMKPESFDRFGSPDKYESPSMYARFQDKYEQWSRREGRKQFAQAKRLEGYAELADQMTVGTEEL